MNDLNILEKSTIVGSILNGTMELQLPQEIHPLLMERFVIIYISLPIASTPSGPYSFQLFPTQLHDQKTYQEAVRKDIEQAFSVIVKIFDILCRILGLQPLLSLLQYVNRLGFEISSVNRTRKLGYVNLNWPRCSARVTESLALTDGSFCRKLNTLYFRLCNTCEFMMCILIVDHQFNRMHPWCSWECMLPGRCSPGKR